MLSKEEMILRKIALQEEVKKEIEAGNDPLLVKKQGIDLKDLFDQYFHIFSFILTAASVALGFIAVKTGNYENPALLILLPLSLALFFLVPLFISGVPGKKQISRNLKCGKIHRFFAHVLFVLLVCAILLNIGMFPALVWLSTQD